MSIRRQLRSDLRHNWIGEHVSYYVRTVPRAKRKQQPHKRHAETGKAWIACFLSSIAGHGMTKSICILLRRPKSPVTVTGLQQYTPTKSVCILHFGGHTSLSKQTFRRSATHRCTVRNLHGHIEQRRLVWKSELLP